MSGVGIRDLGFKSLLRLSLMPVAREKGWAGEGSSGHTQLLSQLEAEARKCFPLKLLKGPSPTRSSPHPKVL